MEVKVKGNTMQYNTIQYNTIQYNTILYNTIQYNTIQYDTKRFHIRCDTTGYDSSWDMVKSSFIFLYYYDIALSLYLFLPLLLLLFFLLLLLFFFFILLLLSFYSSNAIQCITHPDTENWTEDFLSPDSTRNRHIN